MIITKKKKKGPLFNKTAREVAKLGGRKTRQSYLTEMAIHLHPERGPKGPRAAMTEPLEIFGRAVLLRARRKEKKKEETNRTNSACQNGAKKNLISVNAAPNKKDHILIETK